MTYMKKIVFCFAIAFAAGCSSPPQRPPPEQLEAREDALIAVEKSRFKQAVADIVAGKLQADNRSVRVITLKELKDAWPERHKAVVIINEIWAWRLSGAARRFLAKISPDQRGKVVLVSTAGDEGWRTGEQGVHAITAASRKGGEQKLADSILEQLTAIFSGG